MELTVVGNHKKKTQERTARVRMRPVANTKPLAGYADKNNEPSQTQTKNPKPNSNDRSRRVPAETPEKNAQISVSSKEN